MSVLGAKVVINSLSRMAKRFPAGVLANCPETLGELIFILEIGVVTAAEGVKAKDGEESNNFGDNKNLLVSLLLLKSSAKLENPDLSKLESNLIGLGVKSNLYG